MGEQLFAGRRRGRAPAYAIYQPNPESLLKLPHLKTYRRLRKFESLCRG
jgi:hypothetical protein